MFITDEGKKQNDAAVEEPAAEEPGAASGSAAGKQDPCRQGETLAPVQSQNLELTIVV